MQTQFASELGRSEVALPQFCEKPELDGREEDFGVPECESGLQNGAGIVVFVLHGLSNLPDAGLCCQVRTDSATAACVDQQRTLNYSSKPRLAPAPVPSAPRLPDQATASIRNPDWSVARPLRRKESF